MKLTANVIGATGLVGKQLVKQLLDDENFEQVRIFVRRKSGFQHAKLKEYVVDFEMEETWLNTLKGDVLFSCLGTTLKQAGSKQKQYAIDFSLNLKFAETAKQNGIANYVLVSSIGANAQSRMFYTRIKGELDDAVSKLGFNKLIIIRPASLSGQRDTKRTGEILLIPILAILSKCILKNYRPIKDENVARAMINALNIKDKEKYIWEGLEVFELSNKK